MNNCVDCGADISHMNKLALWCKVCKKESLRRRAHKRRGSDPDTFRSVTGATRWQHIVSKGIPLLEEQYQKLGGPITLRRWFYVLVSAGLLENKKTHYSRLSTNSVEWRENGSMDWRMITDTSRDLVRPHIQPTSILDTLSPNSFMNDPTPRQDNYVEVWVEKAGNIPVLKPLCQEYYVPLVNTGGFPSITFRFELLGRLKRHQNKPCTILYMSDFDADGYYMPQVLESWISSTSSVDVHIMSIALTNEQARGLPQAFREYKPLHARKEYVQDFIERYGKVQVELDALPIDDIRDILESHLDDLLSLDVIEEVREESESIAEEWFKSYKYEVE